MTDVVEAGVEETTDKAETTPPPWDQLRQAREEKNLQQSDIAKELKLDLRFVKALEEGRLEELPQPVYTAGYIRAYAKLVGLPADKIVGDYATQEVTQTPKITRTDEKVPARYRHVKTALPKSFSVSHGHMDEKKKIRLLGIVLAVVVALAIAWQSSTKMSESDSATTEGLVENASDSGAQDVQAESETMALAIPKLATEQPASETPSSEQQLETTTLQDNAEQVASILLRYSEDSWVDIRDATGKPLIRRLGTAGGSNKVTGIAPFEVLLGYSPGVSIEYNGEPLDLSRYQNRAVARFVMDETGLTSKRVTKRDTEQAATPATNDLGADKAQFYVNPDE